jgi:phenylalanine-4-hydroxylase
MNEASVLVDQRSGQSIPADYIVDQRFNHYAQSDHDLWSFLYQRQKALLPGRAVDEFLRGLDELGLSEKRIPDFRALNARLAAATGWQIVAVPGLVPDAVFFAHLAARRFPAGYWIRSADQCDYIEEPDVFHDVFGHAPLLMQHRYANYMQAYGAAGLRLAGSTHLKRLARLYWYTVEFGLMQTTSGLRIFGAGIVSSAQETVHALEADAPRRIAFDEQRVLRTAYEIDHLQRLYFVLRGYDDLPPLDAVSLDEKLQHADAGAELAADDSDPDDIVSPPEPVTRHSAPR